MTYNVLDINKITIYFIVSFWSILAVKFWVGFYVRNVLNKERYIITDVMLKYTCTFVLLYLSLFISCLIEKIYLI